MRSVHKEQYRREYIKHVQEVLDVKIKELINVLERINDINMTFEEWYAQNFPDKE